MSVVVPVRDGARFLGEALASVLAQDPPPDEVVVVDDGSVDASAAIAAAAGPSVRVVAHERPAGRGAARNTGWRAARGELVAFLDADDRWVPGALATLRTALAPDADMAWGAVREFATGPDAPRPRLAADGWLLGATLLRRRAFDRVGPFREDLAIGEAVDWVGRARDAGLRAVPVDQVVLERRVHRVTLAPDAADERRDLARVVKAALDRRRKAAG